METLLPLFVAIPIFSAILILLVGKWDKKIFPRIWSILTTLSLLVLLVLFWDKGTIIHEMSGWKPPYGIVLIKDSLSQLMLLIVNGVAFLTIVYSYSYMLRYEDYLRFFSLFMLMLAGMNGVVLTGDLFNLYVFLEIASLASYALVGYGVGGEELEASFKYLILGVFASMLILFGIGIVYSVTGSLNMADIARFLISHPGNEAVLMASGLFIVGFGLKAGLVPFHAWLPDAHPSAPAPISAMLSGVLIKVLGIYSMIRVFYHVIGIAPIISNTFLAIGCLSMIVGALMGFGQDDMKRLFAFSSISQMGFVMVGIGLGTPLGIIGALFHLLNHAGFKSLLFLSSGAIEGETGTRNLSELGGLREKMPVTSASSVVGSLSISGVPPFNGFWSKLIIILAAFQAGKIWVASLLVLTAFLTLSYYLKFQKNAIFGNIVERVKGAREAPMPMVVPLVLFAVICLFVGVFNYTIISNIIIPAQQILMDRGGYILSIFGSI
ncbi:MAG: monovalent cation/H+ antiporter subunit D family protein [candidate division WOR-3 bacterium]|nr:monovalent cation/H+ antiporter subunit D family protein [candidate division WOR-3 bacterium]